jgi:hypothetical protein
MGLLSSCNSTAITGHYQDNKEKPLPGKLVSVETKRVFDVSGTDGLANLFINKLCNKLQDPANCESNKANLNSPPFNFNSDKITNNLISVDKVIDAQVIYSGIDAYSKNIINLSGTIIYPKIDNHQKFKGVILYFHPTIFAPNSLSDKTNNNADDIVYASVYATQGYIVVLPDYNGNGIDSVHVHPYVLYPYINTLNSLHMLTAVRNTINNIAFLDKNEEVPLFTAGYSEGGAYSIWFSRLSQTDSLFSTSLHNNHYKLKASVGMEGAYDVSGTIKNFLWDDVKKDDENQYKILTQLITNLAKPGLTALALISYGAMHNFTNQNNYLDYRKLFNPEFFDMDCTSSLYPAICLINQQHVNIYQALRISDMVTDSTLITPIAMSALGKQYNSKRYSSLLSMALSTDNSIISLIGKNIKDDPEVNTSFKAADVYSWHTNLPLYFISLQNDSIVSPLNTEKAIANISADNPDMLKNYMVDNSLFITDNVGILEKLPIPIDTKSNIDHVTGGNILNILALNYFNNFTINKYPKD